VRTSRELARHIINRMYPGLKFRITSKCTIAPRTREIYGMPTLAWRALESGGVLIGCLNMDNSIDWMWTCIPTSDEEESSDNE
jgi:hypothetical protein